MKIDIKLKRALPHETLHNVTILMKMVYHINESDSKCTYSNQEVVIRQVGRALHFRYRVYDNYGYLVESVKMDFNTITNELREIYYRLTGNNLKIKG